MTTGLQEMSYGNLEEQKVQEVRLAQIAEAKPFLHLAFGFTICYYSVILHSSIV